MTKAMLALLGTLIAVSAVSTAQAATKADGFWNAGQNTQVDRRRKPRVKGGSGCDDPGDAIEHPECR